MNNGRQSPPRAVVLVGFMGAGKTSVGQALARRLGWRFVDLDDRIMARDGRPIAAIFQESGEAAFRQCESQALADLLRELPASPATVVALGGGAFTREENIRLLGRSGSPVVFLDAPLEELRRRCAQQGDERPLYRDENLFRQLYDSRRRHYMKAALRLDTQAKSVEQVAAELASLLRLDGNRNDE